MSRFRGRGGPRRYAKEEPFIRFPTDIELPDPSEVQKEVTLVARTLNLQRYQETSPYVVEDKNSEKNNGDGIERYSDRKKPRHSSRREAVSTYMKLEPGYFPLELLQGLKAHPRKKLKWKPKTGIDKIDVLEKLEEEFKNQGAKNGKLEDGNEEENEEEADDDDDEEDYDSDDDYQKNKDFDDDEDDYNKSDSGDDEGGLF